MTKVAWLFSLARCGSSITAYAGASPWGAPVADEILGPWDRTTEPYGYPLEQIDLVNRFQERSERLSPELAEQTRRLIERIAGRSDRVVVKIPHLMITPEEFETYFPDHACVRLLRNPLRRLNSLYANGWMDSIGPGGDLERFAESAERWARVENRLTYEELEDSPQSFFRRLWSMWGWGFSEQDVQAAVSYKQRVRHRDSIHTERGGESRAARAWCVPRSVSQAYLRDARMQRYLGATDAPRRVSAYVRSTRLGVRRAPQLESPAARGRRARYTLRANLVREVWAKHGRVERPRLLDLAAEDGCQMLMCFRAVVAREAIGVELDPGAAAASDMHPIGCRVVQGDILRLSETLPRASFDLITALSAFDGLDDPEVAVREASSCLRPGGILIVTSPAPLWLRLVGSPQTAGALDWRALARASEFSGLSVVDRGSFMNVGVIAGAMSGVIVDPERASRLETRLHRLAAALGLVRFFVLRKHAGEQGVAQGKQQ